MIKELESRSHTNSIIARERLRTQLDSSRCFLRLFLISLCFLVEVARAHDAPFYDAMEWDEDLRAVRIVRRRLEDNEVWSPTAPRRLPRQPQKIHNVTAEVNRRGAAVNDILRNPYELD